MLEPLNLSHRTHMHLGKPDGDIRRVSIAIKKRNQILVALRYHVRKMVVVNKTGGLGKEELEKIRSIFAKYLQMDVAAQL